MDYATFTSGPDERPKRREVVEPLTEPIKEPAPEEEEPAYVPQEDPDRELVPA